ncbi:branch migration of Holliday junctions%2C junction-specific DNA helicase%2CATP-dependent DNA helicase%2C recG homolog [Streptococcus pneumoniae]|nr:branch migration of Holliday junctions%2C junction-specific DNA helicase%2CATP-dependent DNA helicase%2C recG homolog [Streptococcus pneumoniae]
MNLHQPLHVLPGVGLKSAEKYAKLGIENLQDLSGSTFLSVMKTSKPSRCWSWKTVRRQFFLVR